MLQDERPREKDGCAQQLELLVLDLSHKNDKRLHCCNLLFYLLVIIYFDNIGIVTLKYGLSALRGEKVTIE